MASVPEPQDEYAFQNVRGLALPPALCDLLVRGRWKHPGDAVMRKVIPWFEDPLIFLTTVEHMRRESRSLDAFSDDDRLSPLFRVKRSSKPGAAIELPWLDVERAILIAVNRIPGDDVAIGLDFRDNATDPLVVASDVWSEPGQCSWRLVAPSVLSLAEALGLSGTAPIADFPAGGPDAPIVGWQTDT